MSKRLIIPAVLGGMLFHVASIANLLDDCSEQNTTACVTKNVPGQSYPGYVYIDTLLNGLVALPQFPSKSVLIDKSGNVVQTWRILPFSKYLPGGHVLGGLMYKNFLGPPTDLPQCLVELDWDSNLVWPKNIDIVRDQTGIYCDPNYQNVTGINTFNNFLVTDLQHDIQRPGSPTGYYSPGQAPETGGGATLFISWDFPGVVPNISNTPLLSDKIYEIEAEGPDAFTLLWEWDPVDHVDQGQGSFGDLGLGFSQDARDAIRNLSSPFGLNIPRVSGLNDWLHTNAVNRVGRNHWCEDSKHLFCDQRFAPENIIVEFRAANIIAIIARNDHPFGFWKSGDIVWRVGPDYNNFPGQLDQLIGPHFGHIIPKGLQGAGNMLVFDNGGTKAANSGAGWGRDQNGNLAVKTKFRPYSRVVEFDPITLDIIWSYERHEPVPVEGENFALFRSDYFGSAQRLPNGNTMILEGFTGRIFEVTRRGELVWEFVSPFGSPLFPLYGDPTKGQTGIGRGGSYRAYFVPSSWVPNSSENL